MKEIVEKVSEYYGLPYKTLFKKSRKREVVKPRMMAMFFADRTFSTSEVARFFSMGHASVIHAKKIINQESQYDKNIQKDVDSLSHILGIYPEGKTRYLIDLGSEGTTVKKQKLIDFCELNDIKLL